MASNPDSARAGEPTPTTRVLTAEQQAGAYALLAHLLVLRDLGIRKSEVMIDANGGIRVSPVGRGVDITPNRAIMFPTI